KAILVEQKGYYTFGQLQRGALVLFGTILARVYAATPKPYIETFPLKLAMMGFLSMGAFIFISHENVLRGLITVASNGGKHPPNLQFMSFSLGGALVLLSMSMFFREHVPLLLRPIIWIGQKALQAFV